jgi:hypothetical protein
VPVIKSPQRHKTLHDTKYNIYCNANESSLAGGPLLQDYMQVVRLRDQADCCEVSMKTRRLVAFGCQLFWLFQFRILKQFGWHRWHHSTEYTLLGLTYCRDMEWRKPGLCWRCAWRLQRLHSRWSPGHAAQWFGMRRWRLLTPKLVYRCPTTSLARFAFEDPKLWKVISHISKFWDFSQGFEEIRSKCSVECNLPE